MILRQLGRAAPAANAPLSMLDLTPVIDMVFLLLIFFLAATTFQREEREMQIALPEVRSAGPVTALLQELVINVRADGTAVINGADASDDTLASTLRAALEARHDRKVVVRGDRAAPYAAIARVLDVCRRNGVTEPFLETVPTRSP